MSEEAADLRKLVSELNVKVTAEEIILKMLSQSLLELRARVENDEQWLVSVSMLARHALQHAEHMAGQEDAPSPALPKKPGERDIEVA